MHKVVGALLVVIVVFICGVTPVSAQSVKPQLEEGIVQAAKKTDKAQVIQVQITRGEHRGKTITIKSPTENVQNAINYKKGDRVVVSYEKVEGRDHFQVVDFVRRSGLLILFFLFLVCVFAIGRWQGAASLGGLVFSFLIISRFLVPQVVAGNSPVLMSLLASFLIIPTTFFIAHGFSRKTMVSVVGTAASLCVTAALAYGFILITHLLGFAQEEVFYLQGAGFANLDMQGLLLAGIIIGALGILDDITISQASVVESLAAANPRYSHGELYRAAMRVGRDHIASLVNTLVLVYTGASLPLLLLFYSNSAIPFATAINQEVIATEVVRTLVSSIGIILAVPITTALAVHFEKKK